MEDEKVVGQEGAGAGEQDSEFQMVEVGSGAAPLDVPSPTDAERGGGCSERSRAAEELRTAVVVEGRAEAAEDTAVAAERNCGPKSAATGKFLRSQDSCSPRLCRVIEASRNKAFRGHTVALKSTCCRPTEADFDHGQHFANLAG